MMYNQKRKITEEFKREAVRSHRANESETFSPERLPLQA